MSKDMSNLTPEQLMDLAKLPIKKSKDKNMSPVKEFIVSEDLTPGDERIPGLVIYDRYATWCKNNSITRLSIVKFFNEFKFYFTKKQTKSGVFYSMSSDGFDLSPEKLKILAAAYGKRISKNGKKKNKEETQQEE